MGTESLSFGAKFVYEQGFDYKKFFPKKNKQVISRIDNFLSFIKSEKGRKFLENQPERDIFELRVYQNDFLENQPERDIFELRVYQNDDKTITPKLWHRVHFSDGSYGKVLESIDFKNKK